MLITERKFGVFKFVNIFFAEEPVTGNLPDCDVLTYKTYKNWGEMKGYDRLKGLTTTIDLSQSIDEIWKKIKRQHKRHIHRARKNGTTVTVSNNFEAHYRRYKIFLKQKNYLEPYELNIPSPRFMKKYGTLFIAENQGKILGSNLYFNDENNALLVNIEYQNSGNTIENNKQIADANCYMHWEAMGYFKNRNVRNFDLGGVENSNIPINHEMNGGEYWKRCFGGDIISEYRYTKFSSRFGKLLFTSYNFLRTFN